MHVWQQLQIDKIEFIRFEGCNIDGISIGKLVPISEYKSILNDGLKFNPLHWIINEEDPDCHSHFSRYTYSIGKICKDTYTIIPYLKQKKVASIMISPKLVNKPNICIDPRSVALVQLKKLKKEFGIDLFSTFEHEFLLMDKNTFKPGKNQQQSCFDMSIMMQHEDLYVAISRNLSKMGIDFEAINPESGFGQHELNTKPAWNIKAGDDAHRTKMAVREIAYQHNVRATFIASPWDKICIPGTENRKYGGVNGSHFNMSLWRNKQDNLLYDGDKDDISDMAKYWMGGILNHFVAITAFCSPTINCYSRFKEAPPLMGGWGKNNRDCWIRFKLNGNKSYMEFRAPSGISNPYLIIACVIIAGMDGIKNNSKPPIEYKTGMSEDEEMKKIACVPTIKSLKEAVYGLKNDRIICEELGEFVEVYIAKKEIEVNNSSTDEKQLFPKLLSKL